MEHRISSVERGKALLGEPDPDNEIIILKLQPEPRSCCCFHCWPRTWAEVTRSLASHGTMKGRRGPPRHRRRTQICLGMPRERSPRFLLYLGLATAALNLAKPIVDLLTTFVKGLREERKGPRLKLTRRRVVRGTVEEELLVEIDLPVSRETTKMIEAQVAKALQRDVEHGPTDAGPEK
jgi:hypothetical protein